MNSLATRFEENEVLLLLKQLMMEKMSGTTSMPVDEVENLLQSILYTLTFAEKEGSVAESSVSAKFARGKLAIKKQLTYTAELYEQVLKTNNQLPIDSYQSLLRDFADFFTSYDIDYAAHQTGTLWIDYQLAFALDDQRLKGIDFVTAYLKSLLYENLFCSRFSKQVLQELFEAYGRQLQLDYRRDINNIYERVFFQALGQWLGGTEKSTSLLLSESEFQRLESRIEEQEEAQIHDAFKLLLKEMGVPEVEYYWRSFQWFIEKMKEDGTERRRALFVFECSEASLFLVNEGLLASEFLAVSSIAENLQGIEKIDLLLTNFISVYDYLDFFELSLLDTQEYHLLFDRLGEEMLAVFIKFAMREERETGEKVLQFTELVTREDWQEALQKYLASADKETVCMVDNYLKRIELSPLDFQ